MASNLVGISLSAPGFYGLNTQDSPVSLTPEFALEAQNCIIDKFGRIAARKGWTKASAYDADIGTKPVTLIHEFISDAGASTILFIADGEIWSLNTSTEAVTSVYTGTWTNAGTTGDYNWKAVTFNNNVYFFKRGEDPLVFTAPSTVVKVSAHASYSGTVQTANEVLSAYGRLWTADTSTDKTTIKWSDTLIGQAWTAGASGSLDLENVYTNGTRPIVALAAFNGFLVIFCDTCIIVYEGADDDPATNLALVEVIEGVGCIARDSVQDVGNDIIFLSDTGVRSLARIIDQKSTPLLDISANVRDSLIADVIDNADNEDIKSIYNDQEGLYLLTLVNQSKTYCFDLKKRLEGEICRATTWTLAPYCWAVDKNKNMYLGTAGYVGKYEGYYDNDDKLYVFSYSTSHLNGGGELASVYKILKSCRAVFVNGSGYTLLFSWGTDYKGFESSINISLDSVGTQAEYNIAEYNVDEYGVSSPETFVNIEKFPLSDFGQVFQVNVRVPINGYGLSIQQLDFFVKPGRLA